MAHERVLRCSVLTAGGGEERASVVSFLSAEDRDAVASRPGLRLRQQQTTAVRRETDATVCNNVVVVAVVVARRRRRRDIKKREAKSGYPFPFSSRH